MISVPARSRSGFGAWGDDEGAAFVGSATNIVAGGTRDGAAVAARGWCVCDTDVAGPMDQPGVSPAMETCRTHPGRVGRNGIVRRVSRTG